MLRFVGGWQRRMSGSRAAIVESLAAATCGRSLAASQLGLPSQLRSTTLLARIVRSSLKARTISSGQKLEALSQSEELPLRPRVNDPPGGSVRHSRVWWLPLSVAIELNSLPKWTAIRWID